MVRALPRVEEAGGFDTDEAEGASGVAGIGSVGHGLLDRWAHSELPEKIDGWFNGFLLKFLRKSKVFILKLDNTVSTRLRKIHHEKTANGKKIDFKEISEQNKED